MRSVSAGVDAAMTEFEELCHIWNADAFRLRWQMAYQLCGVDLRRYKPRFNSALTRITGIAARTLAVDLNSHIFANPLRFRLRTYVAPEHRRVLYIGAQENLEVILGVYLWWLTKRGIISA